MKKYKKYVKYAVLSACLLFLAAAIIAYPERYIKTTFGGFSLWAECVLPSLFPFMVITLLFIKTGIAEKASLPLRRASGLFGLPPAAAVCFLMSICSGYPAGARLVSEFSKRGAVQRQDCAKLSYLCSTSGPLFIIGAVGYKMFAKKALGILIYLSHACAVLAVGLIIAIFSKNNRKSQYTPTIYSGNALYESFYSAIISVAVAGGFIAFFATAASVFYDFGLLSPLENFFSLFLSDGLAFGLCTGLFESTAGCRAIAAAGGGLSVPLAGAVITFGGASILFQQLCYLTECGVSPLKFTAVKLIQAAVCFLLLLPVQ